MKILPIANINRVAVTNPINTKLPVVDTNDTVFLSSGAKVTIALDAGVVGGGTKSTTKLRSLYTYSILRMKYIPIHRPPSITSPILQIQV